MLAEKVRKRQSELDDILRELSQSVIDDDAVIEKYLDRLNTIYDKRFRHQYSSFYSVLNSIAEGEEHNGATLEYLSNSLSVLYETIEQLYMDGNQKYSKLYPPFVKLRDHVNLEIARIQYSLMQKNRLSGLEKRIENSKQELDQAKQAVQKATEKAESLQNEIITVLSIFSAVVLAFMGGMSFTGSTLESISKASVYKISFVALICGFVIFNTICVLIYLVAKITGRNIFPERKVPYVVWSNLFFLLMLLLIFVAWLIDLHSIAHIIRSYIFG